MCTASISRTCRTLRRHTCHLQILWHKRTCERCLRETWTFTCQELQKRGTSHRGYVWPQGQVHWSQVLLLGYTLNYISILLVRKRILWFGLCVTCLWHYRITISTGKLQFASRDCLDGLLPCCHTVLSLTDTLLERSELLVKCLHFCLFLSNEGCLWKYTFYTACYMCH